MASGSKTKPTTLKKNMNAALIADKNAVLSVDGEDARKLLQYNYARAFVRCSACTKPRVLYSYSHLNSSNDGKLADIIDEEGASWTCGDALIPISSVLHRQYTKPSSKDTSRLVAHLSGSKRMLSQLSDSSIELPTTSSSLQKVNHPSNVSSSPDKVPASTTNLLDKERIDATSMHEKKNNGLVVNRAGVIVRRGLTCKTPLEAAFYASSNVKSTRMMDPYFTKAFGSFENGCLAPDGWCFSCGSTENMCVFGRAALLQKHTTVYPLCYICHVTKNIAFTTRSPKKMPKTKGTVWKKLDLVCALCTSFINGNEGKKKKYYFPGRIQDVLEGGKYNIKFYDGDFVKNVISKRIIRFVKVNDIVMAKYNTTQQFPAKITKLEIIPKDDSNLLPFVKVDVTFTEDNRKLTGRSIRTILIHPSSVLDQQEY